MLGGLDSAATRRLLIVGSVVLALLVIFDLALFGWLIFRSLSEREIQEALLETRLEAEGLARQIEGRVDENTEDLYTALVSRRETLTFIDSILSQRDFVYTVEITDRDGVLVFRARTEATLQEQPAPPLLESRDVPPQIEEKTVEHEWTRDVSVPIGDVGFLHIGISPAMLAGQAEILRRELITQASTIGAITLVLLVLTYATMWWLWRRGQRLEAQAAEAERMAYVGTLASGLAHEIRNPLNALNLNMQMLEEDLVPDGDRSRAHLLSITRDEIRRLDHLVSDFLAYARPRAPSFERVAAVDLLRRAEQVLAGQWQASGARLTVEDRTDGAPVEVDPSQMVQLLLNLVQNALAATGASGRRPDIRLLARRRPGSVVLEVSDNGVGIAAADQPRVFDLFYSTRKGGTGLGLAIVQRIASAHGAELELESERGVGTTVRVVLPAVARPAESSAPGAQPLPAASPR